MLKRFGIGTMAGVVMALTMPHQAAAQGTPASPWAVTFSAGTAPSVGGTYHEGGAGTVLALPTDVQERKWGTGLENLNDSSSRWTLPVLGTLAVRF